MFGCSSVHYLAYAEDYECVEMIEAKFKALDELQRQKKEASIALSIASCTDANGGIAHVASEPALTHEEQLELFKHTSYLSVCSCLHRHLYAS